MSNYVYENKKEISSAFIDSSVRLGTAQTTVLVQDNVTECFKSFGCDGVTYKKKFNAFWVFSKAKFKFFSRPAWNDFVTVKTFPINNSGIRTNINTQIVDSTGKLVANVKQATAACLSAAFCLTSNQTSSLPSYKPPAIPAQFPLPIYPLQSL